MPRAKQNHPAEHVLFYVALIRTDFFFMCAVMCNKSAWRLVWPSYALIVLLNRSYGNKMLFDVTLLCLFLCRTNPHIHEQGGDSAPTFYSSSKLRKSHFFTASPPLGGFGHFCPIAFLSTPAAHRSVQSWTHLPKIGEVCFLGQPNFGLSFSWRKNPLPVDGGFFRSPLS